MEGGLKKNLHENIENACKPKVTIIMSSIHKKTLDNQRPIKPFKN